MEITNENNKKKKKFITIKLIYYAFIQESEKKSSK